MRYTLTQPDQIAMTPEYAQAILFIMRDVCNHDTAHKIDQFLQPKDVTTDELNDLLKFVGDELIFQTNNLLDRAIKFKRYSKLVKGGQHE